MEGTPGLQTKVIAVLDPLSIEDHFYCVLGNVVLKWDLFVQK
jgi:hypothetical protein